MAHLDLYDREIREMIEVHHSPDEEWMGGVLVSVHCIQCYRPWPCQTILDLRSWKERHPYK